MRSNPLASRAARRDDNQRAWRGACKFVTTTRNVLYTHAPEPRRSFALRLLVDKERQFDFTTRTDTTPLDDDDDAAAGGGDGDRAGA